MSQKSAEPKKPAHTITEFLAKYQAARDAERAEALHVKSLAHRFLLGCVDPCDVERLH